MSDDEKIPDVTTITLTSDTPVEKRVEVCPVCKSNVDPGPSHICIVAVEPVRTQDIMQLNPPICMQCGGWFVESGCSRNVCKRP